MFTQTKYILIAGALLIILAILSLGYTLRPTTVTINDQVFITEIAATPAAQQQGLSDRDHLLVNHGMLFTYTDPQIREFWMLRMHFPLDIIWIRDGRIVDISHNLPMPETGQEPARAKSQTPADAVLEINAGLSSRYGFKVGDRVTVRSNH